MKPRTVRADSFRSQSVTVSLIQLFIELLGNVSNLRYLKNGLSLAEKIHGSRSVLLPVCFFQIVCHRNARMSTPHHISQLVRVLWLVKIVHPIALIFPLNSKVCLNWYLPLSIWTPRCQKNLTYLVAFGPYCKLQNLVVPHGLMAQAQSKDEKTLL